MQTSPPSVSRTVSHPLSRFILENYFSSDLCFLKNELKAGCPALHSQTTSQSWDPQCDRNLSSWLPLAGPGLMGLAQCRAVSPRAPCPKGVGGRLGGGASRLASAPSSGLALGPLGRLQSCPPPAPQIVWGFRSFPPCHQDPTTFPSLYKPLQAS